MDGDIVWLGTVASLIAGLATGFGALPVLFTKRVSDRLLDTMLGSAAGVMMASTSCMHGLIAGFIIMMLLDTIFS